MIRHIVAALGVVCCAGFTAACFAAPLEVPPEVAEAEQRRIEAIAKASAPTISVFARGGQGGGSGVVISPDGYALTNFHVSKPAGNFMKCSLPDGNLYDAVIVGIDPTGDVALIKLFGRDDFPAAELADSDEVRVGDWCFAVGNPFLLATNLQPTVTYGIVSGVHRYQYPAGTLLEYADCIQTDASINPGNSGGPLFNADGNLIGINGRGSFEKRGRVNVGVGYAISINQIKHFLGYLKSGRIVDHATLGATVSTDELGGVVVSNILPTSDAYRRGLRYGDEVVRFGGRDIHTVNGFKNVLGIYPKGWRIPLTYRRDGEETNIYVRLAGVHREDELIAKTQGAPQAEPQPQPQPDGDGQEEDAPEEDGQEEDGQEGEDKPEQPDGQPMPRIRQAREQAKPPEHLKEYFEARRGYANYYFNRLHQERIWSALSAASSAEGLADLWKIEGTLAGDPVSITLADDQLTGVFPGKPRAAVDMNENLDAQLAPEGSGGLLLGLMAWRRLLTLGPDRYGEVYYLGRAPLIGRDGLADVLVATHNVIETRFYFDPESGELIALEMYPDTHVDPCEVRFEDYREVDGRQLPGRIHVRHGDQEFGDIELQKFELPAVAEKT